MQTFVRRTLSASELNLRRRQSCTDYYQIIDYYLLLLKGRFSDWKRFHSEFGVSVLWMFIELRRESLGDSTKFSNS